MDQNRTSNCLFLQDGNKYYDYLCDCHYLEELVMESVPLMISSQPKM